jgi:hypothetical protein
MNETDWSDAQWIGNTNQRQLRVQVRRSRLACNTNHRQLRMQMDRNRT